MDELYVRLNQVRYVSHSWFDEVTPEKLSEILTGFDLNNPAQRILVGTVRCLGFRYFAVLDFMVQGGLPIETELQMIENLPNEQQNFIAQAHDICSLDDFWQEAHDSGLPLYHLIEHAVMAVYLAILSGVVGDKFSAGFFTHPDIQEDGNIFCHTYILQDFTVDPSVFMDIMLLAFEYANAVITRKSMDILPRIQNKIEKYRLNHQSESAA